MKLPARRLAPAVLVFLAVALLGRAPAGAREDTLPALGTELGALPEGKLKALADQACLHCHSADMIRQQRLTEKQWTAEVTKMIGWGAAVPEDQKDALVAYLFQNFGPDNDRFQPVVAAPLAR